MGLIITVKGADYSVPEPTDVVDKFKTKFEAAGGILTTIQLNALTKLVADLGFLASAFDVLYPFLGTTSATQSIGLFSDTTTATFTGSGTHDINGYTNTSTAYCNSRVVMNKPGVIGFFAKEKTRGSVITCFGGQISQYGRIVVLASGNNSGVANGIDLRNTTNNITAKIQGSTTANTPRYMITGDNDSELYMISDQDQNGIKTAHGSIKWSDMIQHIFIGGYNKEGTYSEPCVTTYRLFFSASYFSPSDAKTVAVAINTFLTSIGRS